MKMLSIKGVYGFAALTAALVLVPELALASGLAGSVGTVGTGISNIPGIISGIAYILGAAMIVAGAFKLRAHVENPLQEPIQKGVIRIVIGAALAALPALIGWAQSSIAVSGTATFSSLGGLGLGSSR